MAGRARSAKPYLIISAVIVIPPALSLVFHTAALFPMLLIPGAVFLPALFYRDQGPSSAPPESDEGGGGGPPPPRPDDPPRRPTGGIPLPDAKQGRWRVRDHVRPGRPSRRRRLVREPQRAPTPSRHRRAAGS